jgi:hypothetical protein
VGAKTAGGGGGGGGNAYSLFVKGSYALVKKTLPAGTPGTQVMRELAALWRQRGAEQLGLLQQA